ncbi:MAG: anti-sigma factor [Pseudomonadota bacterium]
MTTVTDEMILAYIDGELGPAETAAVEAAARTDPELARLIEDHRRLAGAVRGAYADVTGEPVPERLIAATRAAPVVSLDAARARRAPTVAVWTRWASMAAALAAGVAVGLGVSRDGALIGGDMRARGQLASALESQLASAPPSDARVRVGLTFRARDGRYCRTFAAARGGPAGLACREGDGWAVRMAVAGAAVPSAEYRTAAVETPSEVLAAAEALMAAPPLDAQAEAAAAKARWR